MFFSLNILFQLTRNTTSGIKALSMPTHTPILEKKKARDMFPMSLNNTKIYHSMGKPMVGEEYMQKIQEASPGWTPL
jgi:hypothetical protein